jgi:hypothetical protein
MSFDFFWSLVDCYYLVSPLVSLSAYEFFHWSSLLIVVLFLCNLIWQVMHVPCKMQGHLPSVSCYAECFCCFVVLAASWTWKIYMVVKSFKWSSDAAPPGTPDEPLNFYNCYVQRLQFTHACISIGLHGWMHVYDYEKCYLSTFWWILFLILKTGDIFILLTHRLA